MAARQACAGCLSLRIDQRMTGSRFWVATVKENRHFQAVGRQTSTIRGHVTRSGKLRIGYFALRHQVGRLDLDETPYSISSGCARPERSRLRAPLAGFGLLADQARNQIAQAVGRPEGAAVAASGRSMRPIC
ncbi:MAG: hypothetical protein R3D53_13395 [Paracoccaceae bacterium]